jgi:photosystem II stability/assembly factor-like uncharacterized protein
MTSDDELIDRLRRTLHTEAARVTSPDDAWERFQEAATPRVVPLHPARSRARYGLPAGIVGLAAAILVAVLVTRGGSRGSSRVATAASAPTTASAASAPTDGLSGSAPSAGAAATSGPRVSGAAPFAATGFTPLSVTFVSPDEGWVLGSATCDSSPCTVLRHTTDGGATWTSGTPLPSATVTRVRFASHADGWAWGGDQLWSTHDAGATWTRVSIPGLTTGWMVEDVEASAGLAHAAVIQVGGSVRLATNPVGSDAWRLSPTTVTLGAGPVPAGQIVLRGAVGWLVQVDRTVVGGARLSGGIWQPWTPPCSNDNGPMWLAASSPTQLVAVCNAGVWGPPASGTSRGEHVFVSADGGATWTEPGPIALPDVGGVAAAPGVITVAGFGANSAVLISSFDGGRSWTTVSDAPAGVTGVADLGFTTSVQGVAVLVGPGQSATLLMTHDGGHSWSPVTFP